MVENDRSTNSDGLFLSTVKQLPDATEQLLQDAWANKLDTAKHVGVTLGYAALAGKVFSMIIPARGPAAVATGIVFAIPIVAREGMRWTNAYDEAAQPGANIDDIASKLARGTVQTGGELGLGFIGGTIGSSIGRNVATSETALGALSQRAQRGVLSLENQTLLALNKVPDMITSRTSVQPSLGLRPQTLAADTAALEGAAGAATAGKVWFAGRNSLMESRLVQAATDGAMPERIKLTGTAHSHTNLSDGTASTAKNLADAKAAGLDFYAITDHNHLAARDGIKNGDPRHGDQSGIPILAADPKAYKGQFLDAEKATVPGQFVGIIGVEMGTIGKVGGGKHHSHGAQFMREVDGSMTTQFRITQPDGTTTTHTHKLEPSHAAAVERAELARKTRGDHHGHDHGDHGHNHGVFVTDRHASVPNTNTGSAGKITVDDGIAPARDIIKESAPKTPAEQALAEANARGETHHGGVNHINLYDVPTFFEAIRKPRTPTFMDTLASPFRRVLGIKEKEVAPQGPDVVKYNDGDYKAMVAHLDALTDTTGGRPIIQLNHPRYQADWNSDLPASVRGRDYGIKSFKNIQEWRDQFGKHASQIEIITGQAMNPKPVETMRPTDLGPINLAGYIDKGLHLSPTFGRDDHFNLPGGRPAGTNVYVTRFDKPGLMDALRERRTTATTSTEKLGGYTTVNDRHFMGDILDQAAVPDLNIKMHFDTKIHPEAQYRVSLYGDRKIGDGRLAKPFQVLDLTGKDIMGQKGVVAFDQVQHTIGNKSAYYVEVQRTDPVTANVDYMWTAPVWVEPKASHSTLMRGIVGAGADNLLLGF